MSHLDLLTLVLNQHVRPFVTNVEHQSHTNGWQDRYASSTLDIPGTEITVRRMRFIRRIHRTSTPLMPAIPGMRPYTTLQAARQRNWTTVGAQESEYAAYNVLMDGRGAHRLRLLGMRLA